jgi:hypothetical protein
VFLKNGVNDLFLVHRASPARSPFVIEFGSCLEVTSPHSLSARLCIGTGTVRSEDRDS